MVLTILWPKAVLSLMIPAIFRSETRFGGGFVACVIERYFNSQFLSDLLNHEMASGAAVVMYTAAVYGNPILFRYAPIKALPTLETFPVSRLDAA